MPVPTKVDDPANKWHVRDLLWLLAAIAVIPLTVVAVRNYQRRTTGCVDVVEATERLASVIARGDRQELESDPLLRDRPELVDPLLRHRPWLIRGRRYWVRACRNGQGDRQFRTLDEVSHLGLIRTDAGDVWLRFWFDRETGQLQLVAASDR